MVTMNLFLLLFPEASLEWYKTPLFTSTEILLLTWVSSSELISSPSENVTSYKSYLFHLFWSRYFFHLFILEHSAINLRPARPTSVFLHHWIILLYQRCWCCWILNVLYYWLICLSSHGTLKLFSVHYSGQNLNVPS